MKERTRLIEKDQYIGSPWYKWGPYLAERAWGTVREDYSNNGDAWNYFPFEEAHRKAFRWGEDGIAGWCDRYQVLAFSPAFWNGKDPLLKERLYGLNSWEGNHGEDVKECYYYLDGTPTHSYMKYLYKYPHAAFPYQQLKERNTSRSLQESEFELIDTGVFDQNAYFDIVIEYAKESAETVCIRITATNRGHESAPLYILPQLWFRNQWGWGEDRLAEPVICNASGKDIPCLLSDDSSMEPLSNLNFDYHLGKRYLYGSKGGKPLFTNNEHHYSGEKYVKDAFHRYFVQKEAASVNPEERGTKACLYYEFGAIGPGQAVTVSLMLTDRPLQAPLSRIDAIFAERIHDADAFYKTVHPKKASAEECMIQRQAFAGMLWNKQFYYFDVEKWFKGDNDAAPPPESRINIRNNHWQHLNSMRILSVPDAWEYPWFAAWDLAFHCLTFALIDIRFAKEQLWLLLFEQFQHPNGAIPAYEWNFSDLNPPVHAWVAFRLYNMEKEQTGQEDRNFLENCFFKLMLNFSFWVNQVDSSGCNVFEGGFLGLDNITLFDRSKNLLDNVMVKQSDGTGWMAMFSLNLMRISLELSKVNRSYETIATKFFQHFVHIGSAMKTLGHKKYSLWDEQDGFFYDTLVYPDGHFSPFRVRSLVGLIPLFAVEVIEKEHLDKTQEFKENLNWFLKNRSVMTTECIVENKDSYFLSLVSENQLSKLLEYISDPNEFRSPYGVRSLSKFHEKASVNFKESQIRYEPGVARCKLKGGNSNWRGPIWFPTNYLLIESLEKFGRFFKEMKAPDSLSNTARSLSESLISLFIKDSAGKRPIFKNFPKELDPHFQNLLQFYEYFDAETGEGLGASHQTGWTGLVANLIAEYRN